MESSNNSNSNFELQLKKIFENRKSIHFQDVSHIIAFLRIALEELGIQEEYKNIMLFSNWYLHPSINKNSLGFKKLDEIYNLVMSLYSEEKNEFKFNSDELRIGIREIINFEEFRKETIKFFTQFDIENNFGNNEYFEKFKMLYFTGICNRPLKFKNETTKRLDSNYKIKGFCFRDIDNIINFEILTDIPENPFIFKF